MNVVKFPAAVSAAVALFVITPGCGGGPADPDVVPASGTVTLDGNAIEGVSVTFVPETGGTKSGYAITDAEGRFEAKMREGLSGLPAGEYRVLFQKLVLPDGSPVPPDAMAADVDARNMLPETYNSPAETPIGVTIGEGGNQDMKFELQSRSR